MTSNRTHRIRLARAYAALAGIGYQPALSRVVAAAEAGLLPDRLDETGLRHALDLLLTHPDLPDLAIDTTTLPARYLRLGEILGPLPDRIADAVTHAQVAGVLPAVIDGDWHPLDDTDDDGDEESVVDHPDWWRRLLAAGRRDDAELACPYPPHGVEEGYLPIDVALDRLETTGDVTTYELALYGMVESEPRDVDGCAHLGNLFWDMADPHSRKLTFASPPTQRQRAAWLDTALEHYLAGVAVAELSLPDPFTGVLRWSRLDNRPFLRALHGLAITLWRLRRYRAAETTLLNMLWLNPADNQGARFILPDMRARRRWEDRRDT